MADLFDTQQLYELDNKLQGKKLQRPTDVWDMVKVIDSSAVVWSQAAISSELLRLIAAEGASLSGALPWVR